MPYRVDVWGGICHMDRLARSEVETWDEVAQLVREFVDAGLLCNVMHTDFVMPLEVVRVREELERKLREMGDD